MNRILSLVLVLALLLCGCGGVAAPSPAVDPGLISAGALLDRLLAAVPEGAEAAVLSDDEAAASLLLYGVDPAQVKACSAARLGGAQAFELAVIDLNAPSSAAEEALLDYLYLRQGAFTGYAPEQAALAAGGTLFAVEGDTRLVLAITEDVRAAAEALTAAGYTRVIEVNTPRSWEEPPAPTPEPVSEPSTEPVPVPDPTPEPEPSPSPSFQLPWGWQSYRQPNLEIMSIYDTSLFLSAWEAGSPDGLLRKDQELYRRCTQILNQIIAEDMSDYEKEWAVYSWLIDHVEYDWRHQDPEATTPRDSFIPHGALVEGRAVCLGFASAFQLLMDLLDVECITVVGAAFQSTQDHAWNMVRLNGQWYCVDATWDLGCGSSPSRCRYFNVTSDYMAKSNHQWDYQSVPMATAEDGGCP